MRNHELAGLEPQTRRSLRVQAESDLARLSVPGAMVYFLIVLVVVFVTPYETDYPATVLSMGCWMLLVGGGHLTAGLKLSASPADTLFRWKRRFRLLVFTQFFLWGLFCAVTMRLYGRDWTAMVVVFCSSVLAGGGTSSLAPDNKLAAVDKPMPMGAEHVLFVDDEEAIVQFGQRVLEQLGYRVTTRTSSLEALDVFEINPTASTSCSAMSRCPRCPVLIWASSSWAFDRMFPSS